MRALLVLALLLRALIPVGYMPAALTSGAPLTICPVASPELHRWIGAARTRAGRQPVAHDHHHVHRVDGEAPAPEGSDPSAGFSAASCPFAVGLSAGPLPAVAADRPASARADGPPVPLAAVHVRSLARTAASARAPPRA